MQILIAIKCKSIERLYVTRNNSFDVSSAKYIVTPNTRHLEEISTREKLNGITLLTEKSSLTEDYKCIHALKSPCPNCLFEFNLNKNN